MTSTSSVAAALPQDPAAFGGAGPQYSPSVINSLRIFTVAERLAAHVQSGNNNQYGPWDFYNQCLSLSRGVDYALANGEIPAKAKDLPMLMKMLCRRKNDEISQAALMVLMISVKNACKMGWFQPNEVEELFTIADEIGKIYCNMGNINAEPSSYHSTISSIMERFYPNMNLGQILVSVEAKPGYGAYTADFHITKSTVLQDKIWLVVAQSDNIETSACLISPQQVNFLLNGKAVDRRTNVFMDSGPQMPTNVTSMLKFGTNLLQAVGQFNGHYVILVAYMNLRSLPDHSVLEDYVQPAISVDTDSDIIEGPSQISLNCPISFSRIKTPVKGRACKHFQCFDFDNFININSRRPSWRCPHCNQYVSYVDIRFDRNMAEILKDVGENILEVIVLADGSWKAVLENDQNAAKMQNRAHNCEREPTEPQESVCSPSAVSNVLDLTLDDDHMEIMDTLETEDRKPFPATVDTLLVTPNSTSLGMNSTGVDQSVDAQLEDDFWSGLELPLGRSDTPTVGVSEHPVQPDTGSPLGQEAEGHDNNRAVNSSMQYQASASSNLQLQFNYINSAVNEYGRSPSFPRYTNNRTPVAVQALPAHSTTSGPQQNLRSSLTPLLPSSSTATPHASLSCTATADGSIAILSDTERQQHFSRSPMNLPQVSGVSSSALQHHSAPQNRGPPVNVSAPSQLESPNRPTRLLSELSNPHLQQALNSRAHPTRPRTHIQQGGSNVQSGGATANRQQTKVNAPAQVRRQSIPVSTGDPKGNAGGTAQSVSRINDLLNLQSEQNWRPSARMRGSLSGRELSDDIRQLICAPTQMVQGTRPQASQVQGSRPLGPQPGQGSRPLGPQPGQGSRPLGPQPGQGPRPQGQPPLQSPRPQGQPPLQSPRPQGQLPLHSPRPPVPQPLQVSRLQGSQPSRPTGLS